MWQRLKPREKIMLALLGVAGLCFVLLKFILLHQFDTYTADKTRLKDLQSKVQAAEAVVKSQDREIELANKAAEQLNEIKPLFNHEMGDGLALVHIGLKAAESRVEIVSFKPSNIVDKRMYLELPSNFEVRGDYRNVIGFIDRMEALPDLSELRTLKIQPEEKKKAAGAGAVQQASPDKDEDVPIQDGVITATFDIVTFTNPTPGARFNLEQVLRWAVGRYNAFQTPAAVTPYPGIKPVVRKIEPLGTPEAIDIPKPGSLRGVPSDTEKGTTTPQKPSGEQTGSPTGTWGVVPLAAMENVKS